jgi:hypothetical protein
MPDPFHPHLYQRDMLAFAEPRDRFAFFCSPGMGKTAVTLEVLADRIIDGRSKGVLIVAPIRVGLITWPAQVAKWEHSSWMRCVNLRTKEGMQAWRDGSADIYLINPEMMPKLLPQMFPKEAKSPADTLVIDELSVAKNPQSKRFKVLSKYLNHFPNRIGLTGTPVPNSYLDLFAQVRLLDDGERLGRAFTRFRDTYFAGDYMGYKFEIRSGAKEVIDEKLADLALVMLGDDWLDLPTCSTEDIEVKLPPEAMKAYKTLEKELLLQLKSSDVVALNAATLAGKLLQITSGAVYGEDRVVNHLHDAKIEALKKLRKKHKDEPILVLTAYQHEMDRVLASIPGARRFHEKDMDEWKAGKIKTWVAQPASLSHGIDGIQVGGRIAVWMTLTWSNEAYQQTNARLVRMGQSCKTAIYRLTCPGTIDDAVAESLRAKSDTQSGLLNALKALQALRNQTP